MKKLFIDLETYSSADLKYGVYAYSSAPDFEILLLAYAYDDEPVQLIDLKKEPIPEQILKDLEDPKVLKIAHNAAFERICLSRHLNKEGYLEPESWYCTMSQATFCGIPSSLKEAGIALEISDQKMEEGKNLISLFSQPYRKKKREPEDYPEQWEQFKEYCIRDVEAERQIYHMLNKIQPLPEREIALYRLDQKINDLGIPVDLKLVKAVNAIQKAYESKLAARAEALAPGVNLRSNKQLLEWLEAKGFKLPNVQAKTLDTFMENLQPESEIYQLLALRKEMAKAASKKYAVFDKAAIDGSVHGTLQYYGASTGRWAGRIIQPQNLARPIYPDIEKIRNLVLEQNLEELEKDYPSLNDALASIVRTTIKPLDAQKLLIADYSAIEARVLAWMAGEQWVLDAFNNGEDLYCKTASQMYGVPVEKHGQNAELRQNGKIASLACGYGGGVASLVSFGADQFMSENQMENVVRAWRKANPNIVRFWRKVESAFKKALNTPGKVDLGHGLSMENIPVNGKNIIHAHLPSGRDLIYYDAKVDDGGRITFTGRGLSGKTETISTWGGKLVENLTQAIARDALAQSLLELDKNDFDIIFHVHDEIITKDQDEKRLKEMIELMEKPIPFFEGLDLKVEGYPADYYYKA